MCRLLGRLHSLLYAQNTSGFAEHVLVFHFLYLSQIDIYSCYLHLIYWSGDGVQFYESNRKFCVYAMHNGQCIFFIKLTNSTHKYVNKLPTLIASSSECSYFNCENFIRRDIKQKPEQKHTHKHREHEANSSKAFVLYRNKI